MSDELRKLEEQAFDAMLDETLGGLNPPDLSGVVLERYESNAPSPAAFVIDTGLPERKRKSEFWTSSRGLVASFAVVAALILWVFVGLPGEQAQDADPNQKVAASVEDPDLFSQEEGEIETTQERPPTPKNKVPRRGIPLLVENGTSSEEVRPNDVQQPMAVQRTVAEVSVLSEEINKSFVAYWRSVGVQPTAETTKQDASERLQASLDLSVPPEMLDDPRALEKFFATKSSAIQLAPAWLRRITNHGIRRIKSGDREALYEELAQCFEGTHALDRTLLSWIEGQNPRSAAFHQAIGSIGKASTVNHLAKLTMSVDLRCVRCHDSKIEGVGKQSEYWEFAAMLKSQFSLKHGEANDQSKASEKPRSTFYELVDGRQKLAEPEVSSRWLGRPNLNSVKSVKQWADALSGSKALAHGVVNSLWELVYGLPLEGRVIDPVTAPHDSILDSIQDRLAMDLIDSKFNIARTLSIIVATPVARRSVPPVLTDVKNLVADASAREQAREAVNAFAAATPLKRRMTLAQRIDQAARSLGGKLDSLDQPFVAQTDDSRKDRPNTSKGTGQRSLDDDFPIGGGDELPVQWLRLLPEQDSRVDHLAYLAGFDELPEGVRDILELTKEVSQEDQNLILQRVWWMLRP